MPCYLSLQFLSSSVYEKSGINNFSFGSANKLKNIISSQVPLQKRLRIIQGCQFSGLHSGPGNLFSGHMFQGFLCTN